MIHSGIVPLDEQLGGAVPGRIHLLTGGPGAGKTTACLQFLNTGLRAGEQVAFLTSDRLTDVIAHARSVALDLEPALRSGQMLLLRFRAEFPRLLDWAGLPDRAIDDLRRLLSEHRPVRLVVDPLTAFLADGSATSRVVAALAHYLEELSATTILTYPGDIAGGYDARIAAVVQHAATIVHLSRADGGWHRMEIVQSRTRAAPVSAVRFLLRPGTGLVSVEETTASTALQRAASKRVRKRAPAEPAS